jgi:hypothetical protein
MPRSFSLIKLDAFQDQIDASAMVRVRLVRIIIDGTAVAVQLGTRPTRRRARSRGLRLGHPKP